MVIVVAVTPLQRLRRSGVVDALVLFMTHTLSKRSEPITHFDFDTWCPYRMVADILKKNPSLCCFKSQLICSTYITILRHVYVAVFYVITICFMVVYVFLYFKCIY